MTKTKVCTKCKKELDVSCFHKRTALKSGLASQCKTCTSIYNKQHRIDNIEYYKEKDKQRIKNNPNAHKARCKQWRINNPDRVKQYRIDTSKHRKEYNKVWKKNNLDKVSAQTARRRVLKENQSDPTTNENLVKFIFMFRDWLNFIKRKGHPFVVDHIKPISKGGSGHENNLQIISSKLNLEKNNKWPLTQKEKEKYNGLKL